MRRFPLNLLNIPTTEHVTPGIEGTLIYCPKRFGSPHPHFAQACCRMHAQGLLGVVVWKNLSASNPEI
jgi:hypothetical protein